MSRRRIDIIVRPIQLKDTAAALASYRAAIAALAAVEYDQATLDEWRSRTPERFEALNKNRQRFVAEVNAQVVGYSGIDIARSEVTEYFVTPSAAGSGVGSALLDAAEGLAVQAGLKEVIVHAALTARGFYERMGYTPGDKSILNCRAGVRCAVSKCGRNLGQLAGDDR